MNPTDPTQLFGQVAASGSVDSLVVAMLAAYFIQWTKCSPTFSWVTPGTARLISALIATATAAGIAMTYNPDGTLIVTGLTAKGIAIFVWTAAKQFVFQDVAFRLGIKLPEKISKAGTSTTTNVTNVAADPQTVDQLLAVVRARLTGNPPPPSATT